MGKIKESLSGRVPDGLNFLEKSEQISAPPAPEPYA
jgi:hypothetical protein